MPAQNLLGAGCVEHVDFADISKVNFITPPFTESETPGKAQFVSLRELNRDTCYIELDRQITEVTHTALICAHMSFRRHWRRTAMNDSRRSSMLLATHRCGHAHSHSATYSGGMAMSTHLTMVSASGRHA